jgi:hypothetical protein
MAVPRWTATVDDSTLRAWRKLGYTLDTISSALGVTKSQTLHRIRRAYLMPRADDPDPATIAARCAEIQAEWSDEERRRRNVYGDQRWTPTAVPVSVLESAHAWRGGCGG